MSTIVPPMTAMKIFLILGAPCNRSACVILRINNTLCSTAAAEACKSGNRKVGELLLQLRRYVRHNHGVIAFVAQFEHVADAMDFGN